MTSKPVVILCPGAWHPGKVYQPVLDELNKLGYESYTFDNPSIAAPKPEKVTASDDVQNARSHMLKHIDAGRDIVVLTHSYGGVVGSAAASNLSKKDRQAAGQEGGVLGLIALCSILVEGPLDRENKPGTQWVQYDRPSKGLSWFTEEPIDGFYHDVEISMAKAALKQLRPNGILAFQSDPGLAPVWTQDGIQGKLAYIRCLQDRALKLPVQDFFLQSTGKDWIIVDMDVSHSPFLNKPAELARICDDLVKKF